MDTILLHHHNHVMLYTIITVTKLGSPADSGFCSEMLLTLEFADSWCRQSPAPASRGTVTTPWQGPGPGAHWSRPWGPWTRLCAPSSPLSAPTPSWTWRSGPGVITSISHWLLRIRGVVTHVTCGMSENTMLDMVMLPTASVSEMIQCFLSPVRRPVLCLWPCPRPDWHNPIPDYNLQVINIQTGDENAQIAFIFKTRKLRGWTSKKCTEFCPEILNFPLNLTKCPKP